MDIMKNYAKQSELREQLEKKVYFISLVRKRKNEQQMDFMLLFKCLFPLRFFFVILLEYLSVEINIKKGRERWKKWGRF